MRTMMAEFQLGFRLTSPESHAVRVPPGDVGDSKRNGILRGNTIQTIMRSFQTVIKTSQTIGNCFQTIGQSSECYHNLSDGGKCSEELWKRHLFSLCVLMIRIDSLSNPQEVSTEREREREI
jgi:hypothetical protein